MLEFTIVSFKNSRQEDGINSAIFEIWCLIDNILKCWAFVWAFIRKYWINENFMYLHFPAFLRMNDESSFDIFHFQNGLIKDLWPYFLIFSNVNDFVDSLFSFFVGKIENPVIKACFFELSILFLNP